MRKGFTKYFHHHRPHHDHHHDHHHHHHHDDHNQIPVVVGPSSSTTPYLVASKDGVWFTSLLTSGDQVGVKDGPAGSEGQPWRMVGVPDGLGAFDNGDGTITVLMNHELGTTQGVPREHGSAGAFVSKLTLDAQTLQVIEAGDLIQNVLVYDTTTESYRQATPAEATFNRLCSGDLPAVSALYFNDGTTEYGTQERIYFTGEETGPPFDPAYGRAFAFQVTDTDGDGTSEAGTAIELARFGNMSFENILLNPHSQKTTLAIATDDSTPGEVYVYVGEKQATGATEFDKAGLTNGLLYGIAASFGDDGAAVPTEGTFTLVEQGVDGDVSGDAGGLALQAANGPITQFGRPEDGQWDPSNPSRFYFVTTGTADAPSRLWALDFADIGNPELGGTITMLLDGSEGQVSLDNMTVTESGLIVIQEDPGSSSRLAKIWMYDPAADTLVELAQHDPARFAVAGAPAPGGFFNTNEESSGIIDVTSLLGNDQRLAFLLDTQAHYSIGGEIVEGGQLQLMYVDLPNPGDSKFTGGRADDTYDGGFGDDRIDGGKGDDTLFGNYGDDKIDGGLGDDTLDGGVGKDRVDGGVGNDVLAGGTGDDCLDGGAGNDSIEGGVGDDRIEGGTGQDFINGGFGHDVLRGGTGADTFYFASVTQGPDTIVDFRSGVDQIQIDVGVDPAEVAFVGFVDGVAGPVSGPALVYDHRSGELSFSASGGTDLVHIATLLNDPALHTADLWLI